MSTFETPDPLPDPSKVNNLPPATLPVNNFPPSLPFNHLPPWEVISQEAGADWGTPQSFSSFVPCMLPLTDLLAGVAPQFLTYNLMGLTKEYK